MAATTEPANSRDGKDWGAELAARQSPPVRQPKRDARWDKDFREGLRASVEKLGYESVDFAEGYADAFTSLGNAGRAKRR